jgi:GNAT superfamily N-acetyltransferase
LGEQMVSDEWLNCLIAHEALYTAMIARCEQTEHAWFLHAPAAPEYRDGNRAIRLRAANTGPDETVQSVLRYYRDRNLPPIADVDPVSESQGFVDALLRAGMSPTSGDRLLMRYVSTGASEPASADGAAPSKISPHHLVTSSSGGDKPLPYDVTLSPSNLITLSSRRLITITVVPNETGAGEAKEWIETSVADDLGYSDESLWRTVAQHEAAYTRCRLYLARLNGQAAGVCDLFEANDWGRIDSVVTQHEYRRRGVASALIARAVSDSLTHGNCETYLFTERGGDAERLYRQLGFVSWHWNIFRQYRADR